MGIWALVAIQVGLFILSAYLKSALKDDEDERNPKDLSPTSQEGIPVSLYWGRVRVRNPNVIWFYNLGLRDNQYRATIQYAIGTPSVPATLHHVWVNEKSTFIGELTSEAQVYHFQDPAFFGGEGRGGGLGELYNTSFVQGMIFYPGSFTQTISSAISEQYDEDDDLDSTLLPAYRGLSYVVFSSYVWGESGSLPPVHFEVSSIPNALGAGPIGSDANPAEVIYDILTNPWSRVGLPTGDVDSVSFLDAATTLASESHGISLVEDRGKSPKSVLRNILAQIDGVLYQDPSDGLLKLKLIREDYVIGNLPLLFEDNILAVKEYAVPTWDETYNQVRVEYIDRSGAYTTRSAMAQDHANITIQGKIRPTTIRYQGISNGSLAGVVASRELRVLSLPLAKVKLTVSRDAATYLPGDVFRFSWADYGVSNMVLRVQNIDLGRLEAGEIGLECVQDQFAFGIDILEQPPVQPPASPTPGAATEYLVIETPRWLNTKLPIAGGDWELPHLLHAVEKPAAGINDSFDAQTLGGSAQPTSYVVDKAEAAFANRATVESKYDYSTDEYDATTGLQIENLTDPSVLITGSEFGIRNNGVPIILVGTELMAYESWTDLGSGVYRLNNVWRGLLDTAPQDHPFGEEIWFLATIDMRGLLAYGQSDELCVRHVTRNIWNTLDTDLAPVSRIVLTNRAARPHPPDSLLASNVDVTDTKLPGTTMYDKMLLSYQRRRYNLQTIYKPDDSDDADPDVLLNTRYDIDATVVGDGEYSPTEAWVELSGDVDGSDGATGNEKINLGKAVGHGDVRVRVQAKHDIAGAFVSEAHQSPYVQFHAHRWRQLAENGTFDNSGEGWTNTTTGSPVFSGNFPGGTNAMGGVGSAIGESSWSRTQTVDLSGWENLQGLRAVLRYFSFNDNSDTNDTLEVSMQALDSGDSVISTVTSGAVIPDHVDWQTNDLLYELPATTKKIKITITATAVGITTEPKSQIAALRLQVGQLDTGDDIVSNGHFDTNTTGWTVGSGTWTGGDSTDLAGGGSLAPTATGSGEIYQDINLNTGYKQRATAWVSGWMRRTSTGGASGEFVIEARTSGDTVLASTSTGVQIPDHVDWTRYDALVDFPDGTNVDKVRIRILSDGAAATQLRVDEMRVFVFKELHPTEVYKEATFESQVQTFPGVVDENGKTPSRSSTKQAWEDFGAPTPRSVFLLNEASGVVFDDFLNIVDGDTNLSVLAGTVLGQTFAGHRRADGYTWKSAFEVVEGNKQGARFPNQNDFSVDGANSWTILIAARSITHGTERALMGSMDETGTDQGWKLTLNTSGHAVLRVATNSGLSGSVSVNSSHIHGVPHYYCVQYNHATGALQLITSLGATATLSVPSGSAANLQRVQVGSTPSVDGADTQVGYCVTWLNAGPVQADFDAWWRYGKDPSQGTLTVNNYDTEKTVIGPIDSDTDGVVASAWAGESGQIPVIYNASLTEQRGISVHREHVSLRTLDPVDSAAEWSTGGTITVTKRVGPDASRWKRSVTILGTSTSEYQTPNIPLGSPVDIAVTWYARADSAITAAVLLVDTTSDIKETHTYSVTTEWQRFTHVFTAWDAATANFALVFLPSNTGTSQTLELSGPIGAYQRSIAPFVDTTDQEMQSTGILGFTESLTGAFNEEGEISLTGICANESPTFKTLIDLKNGTDNDDRRLLRIDGNGDLAMDHYNGSGSSTTVVAGGTIDWSTEWTVRGRWNNAGIREDNISSPSWIGVIAPDGATAYSGGTVFSSTAVPIDIQAVSSNADSAAINGIVSKISLRSREDPL